MRIMIPIYHGSIIVLLGMLLFSVYGCGSDSKPNPSDKVRPQKVSEKTKSDVLLHVHEVLSDTKGSSRQRSQSGLKESGGAIEVIPPRNGNPGLTLAQVNAMREAAGVKRETDSDSIEVMPPRNGKPGLTLGQVNAMIEASGVQKETHPSQIIPPEKSK